MNEVQRRGISRSRISAIIGIVVGLLFLALSAAAFLGGGGPIVGGIAAAGGVVVLIVSIVHVVRA